VGSPRAKGSPRRTCRRGCFCDTFFSEGRPRWFRLALLLAGLIAVLFTLTLIERLLRTPLEQRPTLHASAVTLDLAPSEARAALTLDTSILGLVQNVDMVNTRSASLHGQHAGQAARDLPGNRVTVASSTNGDGNMRHLTLMDGEALASDCALQLGLATSRTTDGSRLQFTLTRTSAAAACRPRFELRLERGRIVRPLLANSAWQPVHIDGRWDENGAIRLELDTQRETARALLSQALHVRSLRVRASKPQVFEPSVYSTCSANQGDDIELRGGSLSLESIEFDQVSGFVVNVVGVRHCGFWSCASVLISGTWSWITFILGLVGVSLVELLVCWRKRSIAPARASRSRP
jgi:hypothetical protein